MSDLGASASSSSPAASSSATASVPAPESAPVVASTLEARNDRLSSNMTRVTAATGAGGDDDDGNTVGGSTIASKTKSPLVIAAEAFDPKTALLSGYLRKQNSADKWQKRWFTIVGGNGNYYWCYYKNNTPESSMLCAMDLGRASSPALVDENDPACATFGISWDRYRLFKASSHAEAVRWVSALRQAQAMARPPAASVGASRASSTSMPSAAASASLQQARGSAVVVQNAMQSVSVDSTGAAKGGAGARSSVSPSASAQAPGTEDWKPKSHHSSQAKSGICSKCVIM